MNSYLEMKERHQKEYNEFPMKFAFNQKQLEEGMRELGLKPNQTDKICGIGGGGFILKTDKEKLVEMSVRHGIEVADAISNDTTGEGFIFEMFDYELANHEYIYTMEVEDTIEACGFIMKDIEASKQLSRGLTLARKNQLKGVD